MSLTTSDKIRTLQRKPYLKAKAEPGFRFYVNVTLSEMRATAAGRRWLLAR